MKVLFIIPLMIVAAISGYNLIYTADSVFLLLLHLTVFLACAAVLSLLVRAMFAVQYIEEEESQPEFASQESTVLQHG